MSGPELDLPEQAWQVRLPSRPYLISVELAWSSGLILSTKPWA
jgi:hypothetical protein